MYVYIFIRVFIFLSISQGVYSSEAPAFSKTPPRMSMSLRTLQLFFCFLLFWSDEMY